VLALHVLRLLTSIVDVPGPVVRGREEEEGRKEERR
jgi:hypothetical protein